jgi:hypothetical protein
MESPHLIESMHAANDDGSANSNDDSFSSVAGESRASPDFALTPIERAIQRWTLAYPATLKVVVDPFPRWHVWARLRAMGADLLIGKPFDAQGLLDTIEATWESSSSIPS